MIDSARIKPGEEAWVGKSLSDWIKAKNKFTPKKKEHIKVISDKCTGCGLCYKFCLGGVFDMDEKTGKAVVARLETCMECGTCELICPSEAIDWDYPEGGTGVIMKWS